VLDDRSSIQTPVPTGSALLRLIWMAGIPVMLLCVLLIANQSQWTFGAPDVVLAVLLVAAIVARALDALRYGGTTARGEPANRSHVVGYAARLLPLTGSAWLLAQSVAL
jgi:hypothetical protein